MKSEFIAKVRKDFEASELPEYEWQTYLMGYLACLKRFGGAS